jgi:5-methylcytosine-specific restriction endonuclease McrBC regulatory subunit McrC
MSSANEPYQSWEHHSFHVREEDCPQPNEITSKHFGSRKDTFCYEKRVIGEDVLIEVGYYIGVDWLVEGHKAIVVAPKLNTRLDAIKNAEKDNDNIEIEEAYTGNSDVGKVISIDYFAMLQQCLHFDYLYKEIDNLLQIDWKAKEISISQSQDWLSPLLIVKFLNVLKSIVRKGLKKAYYPTTQNLTSKIKGKILVGQHVKQNLVKNRVTQTLCRYEEFGIDNMENRLLKKAFGFATSYLENHTALFGNARKHFTELGHFCRPAFEMVGDEVSLSDIKHYKPNLFFKEYKDGIQLAKLILKRYAYTISNTAREQVTTPPYWIDMPKLFELYAYRLLKERFTAVGKVKYHFTTYGNELDFLINASNSKMVVDAKYKPLYIYAKNHEDIRQVSGYARLQKVYDELKVHEDKLIDCLIIYPDVENGCSVEEFCMKDLTAAPISGYKRIYKIGIKLPVR